jgi:drug/metabolite transporter (DMT)-like permease
MSDLTTTAGRPEGATGRHDGPAPSPAEEGRATLMLLVVTVIWGLSFSWLKDWQTGTGDCPGGGLLSSLTLIGLRMGIAFVIVAVILPGLVFRPSFREHLAGAVVGVVFLGGHLPQVWGLATTTPALSALFTSLSSAWVPLAAWLYLGERPTVWTLPGFFLAIAGTLAIAGLGAGGAGLDGSGLHFGDWLTLLGSLAFTGQIIVLDRLGRLARPGHLTAGFFAGPGLLSLALAALVAALGPGMVAWRDWTLETLRDPAVQANILRVTLLPTVLGFHWMNLYQPRVSASRAALIYLLEPVFAAMYSVWLGHDRLTFSLVLGGCLILAGNAVLELPNWLPRRAPAQ